MICALLILYLESLTHENEAMFPTPLIPGAKYHVLARPNGANRENWTVSGDDLLRWASVTGIDWRWLAISDACEAMFAQVSAELTLSEDVPANDSLGKSGEKPWRSGEVTVLTRAPAEAIGNWDDLWAW